MRVCTGVCACVSAPASWPRRRAKTAVALRKTGKNRERLARISARALSWAAAPARTCPNTTQRSASPAASAVARCDGGVPPRLEGRGIHRGAGKRVLTSVATSRSAGISEEMQSGVVGEESDGGAEQRKQGMSGVVVLGFPVSWRSTGELRVLAAVLRCSCGRPPIPLFFPPSPLSSGERAVWTGDQTPKVARIGSSRGLRQRPLIGKAR
jgi:hypothetical protein